MDTTVKLIREQVQGKEIKVHGITVSKIRRKQKNKYFAPFLCKQVMGASTTWFLCYNVGLKNSHYLVTCITDTECAS